MRYYYNPTTDQYAKVIALDHATGIAEVVIDDKHQPMKWDDFIAEFRQLADVRPSQASASTDLGDL